MKERYRKSVLLAIAVIATVILYFTWNSSPFSTVEPEPAKVPEFESEVSELVQRHGDLLEKAKKMLSILSQDKERGTVIPSALGEQVLSMHSQAIPVRIKQLKELQVQAYNDENLPWSDNENQRDMVQLDLLDAYIAFLFELRSLSILAAQMKSEMNEDTVKLMRTVAAVRVPVRHGDRLRKAWVYNIHPADLADYKKIPQLIRYRNGLIYDWRPRKSAEARRKLAEVTELYFSRLFPVDSVAWAEGVLESLPQRESNENLVAGTTQPKIRPNVILGSIKAVLGVE